ncbi:MAG TPA: rhomboid family intramembrane serine protease [Verrucomicrobiales bacterium]|nr:rhomboid family intramembrane serine protease [Verrucomicrobiales bacterium]
MPPVEDAMMLSEVPTESSSHSASCEGDSESRFGPDLICISQGLSRARADEEGLVMLAMGSPYWVFAEPDGYAVCVAATHAEAAGRELAVYNAEESVPYATQRELWRSVHPAGAWIPFSIGLLVATVFLYQATMEPALLNRLTMDTQAVLDGREWWRPLTALFLHSNPLHLAGNLVAGALYGFLVARSLGYVLGWILILLSGYLGNVLKAMLVYPDPHRSLGASTAVFGALGILAGMALVEYARSGPQRSRRWWIVPLGAALALFGLTGIGDAQTDSLAHFTGLACGVLLGAAASWLRSAKPSP